MVGCCYGGGGGVSSLSAAGGCVSPVAVVLLGEGEVRSPRADVLSSPSPELRVLRELVPVPAHQARPGMGMGI